MPIDYEYGNPIFVGLAAGQVGQALDKRAQEQIDFDRMMKLNQAGLQQQQLDEQARQFNIAKTIEQNLANLQDQRARQQQGLQFSRDRAQAGQQQLNDWRDFQQQLALNQANRLGMMEQLGYQNELQRLAATEEDQRAWMMDAGEQANVSAKQTLSDYQKMNLSPEGQQLRSQWRAKINAYQAKQGELRPQTYAQGMNELLAGMQKAGIEDFEQQDMTPEESLAQSTRPYDDLNVWTRKADGSWVINKLQPPAKETAEKPVDPSKELVETPYGRPMTAKDFETRYRTDYADAERRVIARKKAKAMEGDNPNPDAEFSADPEEINEEIRKFNEAAAAFREGRKADKDGEKQKPAQPYTAPTLDQILGGQAANTPLQAPFAEGMPPVDPYSDPSLAMPPPPFPGKPVLNESEFNRPQGPPPIADMFPEPAADAMPPQSAPSAPAPAPPAAPAAKIPPRYAMPTMKPEAAAKNQDVKGWFKYLDTTYFKALTPEETINLPAGTQVVLPDGRIATKK